MLSCGEGGVGEGDECCHMVEVLCTRNQRDKES